MIAACKFQKKPTPRDRRRMVTDIVDHMINVMKDGRRRTAVAIAQIIVNEYPVSFADYINGNILGDGSQSLMKQIYTKINYCNRTRSDNDLKQRVGQKRHAQDQIDKKFDEYGCAAYQPLLTEEKEETQKEMKKDLIVLAAKPKRDTHRIKYLLTESYLLQRLGFNERKGLIFDILQEWPLLKEMKYFSEHANKLIDKNMIQTFEDNISKFGSAIHQLMTAHVVKILKKKVLTATKIRGILSECNNAADDLRSDAPLTLALFPLLVNYFEEDSDKLYIVTNVSKIQK